MILVQCNYERHAEAILAIFNDAILNSTVVYDYKPRTMEKMAAWFEDKRDANYPVIGMENQAGELMGFSSFGMFRVFPAYKYTVEHSVYVVARFRGQGIGKRLLREIIDAAQKQDYHTLIGVIDSANTVSVSLHQAFGFKLCGTIPEVAFKFGGWLDVLFYQLILPTPSEPVDG